MTGWVVVLTAFLGMAHVEQKAVTCPTMRCVVGIEAHARRQSAITRMQVFRASEYAQISGSAQFIWRPVIDLTFD